MGELKTGKKLFLSKVVFLLAVLLAVNLTGCVQEKDGLYEHVEVFPQVTFDKPSVLPSWRDGEYHNYYSTVQKLKEFDEMFPNLVDLFSIGKSVFGRDIWCIRITNEDNSSSKLSCLIDGCIHGCEWEAGEACLYLAEYLLLNFGVNATVTAVLNTTEVYVVPLVNPDGRENDERWNADGVDLNRNFDVDFGRLRGHALPLGKIFGRIKIPVVHVPLLGLWFTNCGRYPFSEPETRALRGLMKKIDGNGGFSFYVNCHTAMHMVITPWNAFKPPFELTTNEKDVFSCVRNWVAVNTEYEDKPMSYYASGTAIDWCFKEFHVPCFTFEILSRDYEPGSKQGKHDHLVHWMKTTLPFFLYLLVNIDNLHDWQVPDRQPPLPDGVPPLPLK
ncbi:MAG TPA: DUF2817 domain-containing protein [Thermoplasmatales archaeon]|nr:DUF2817 domain-containing protein [Thermoplasmatales archaeon]